MVHVNDRSGLGRPIIMKPPRGQMCNASESFSANSPAAVGGMFISL
jgi:hypothetical protein